MIPAHIASWALKKSKPEVVAHVGDVRIENKHKPRKKQERVLQTKGGSAPPAPPDPMKEAQAREWEASQAAARDKANADAAAAKKALDDAAALSKWQGGVANTAAGVENYGRRKLESLGMNAGGDPYGIWDMFTNNLQQNRNSLKDNQDYSTLISNSVFDNALNDSRTTARNKYGRDLTNGLGADYLDTTFANTIDDSILDAILGDQYTGAQTSLKNAMDRGQMGQSAYDRALSSLNTRKTAARGELENTGRTAIGGLRSEVETALNNSKTRANNFDFGDTYDPNAEVTKIKGLGTDALGRLDTTVRQAVGDKQFFDPNSIIQSAIAAGGASNYTPAAGGGVSVGGTGGTDNGKNALGAVFADQARNKQTEGMF